jgi:CHAD domain-containing protein
MRQAKVIDVATQAIADGVARLADGEAAVRRITAGMTDRDTAGDGGGQLEVDELAGDDIARDDIAGEDIARKDIALEDNIAREDIVDEDVLVEAVHEMRVATRRLRSDLRTFREALEETWARELRTELTWLAEPLGRARDADVLAQRLAARVQELGASERAEATQLTAALRAQQASARTRLLRELDCERHRTLRNRLESAARMPAPGPAGARSASKELPRVLSRAWHRLEQRVDALGKRPSNSELHTVRIAAKRCRYAAEACAPWLGKPARRLARAAKRLQETLGELNDAIVACSWLEDWARSAPSAQAAELARELVAMEHAAARRARKRWLKAWEQVASAAPG